MPSNCGVRTLRTKPMRSSPGSAPSSARTFWPSHRMQPFERLFDPMSTPSRMRPPLGSSPIRLRRAGCHLRWITVTSNTDGPKDNKNLKWAMGGVAALAVLATIVAAVLLFGDGGSGGPNGGSDNGAGQETAAVASARDTGPVAVITDDPSCTAWAA